MIKDNNKNKSNFNGGEEKIFDFNTWYLSLFGIILNTTTEPIYSGFCFFLRILTTLCFSYIWQRKACLFLCTEPHTLHINGLASSPCTFCSCSCRLRGSEYVLSQCLHWYRAVMSGGTSCCVSEINGQPDQT